MTAPPWHSPITKAGWWKTPNPGALDAMPFFVTIWYSGCDTLEAASTTRHVAYVASGKGFPGLPRYNQKNCRVADVASRIGSPEGLR